MSASGIFTAYGYSLSKIRSRCYNNVMLVLELFSWWFGQGWQQVAKNSGRRLVRVANLFSVPILLRTLWAPWRRIITYPGASIDAKLRAMGDNLVSRFIGFTVRLLVLLTAAIMLIGLCVVGVISIILWPLVPFLIAGLILKAAGV
jgi:hypothetical protein